MKNYRNDFNIKINKIIIFMLIIILFLIPHLIVEANPSLVKIEKGEIIFETNDTPASTAVRWKTVGFTICREKTLGNPNKSNNKAVIMLDPSWMQSKIVNGRIKVYFTVPEKEVNKALKSAGLSEIIKSGDKLYLNGIFRIIEGGTEVKGEQYNTLQSIKKARPWKNPNDFNQRFDIEVIYDEPKTLHMVKLELQVYEDGQFTKKEEKVLGKFKVFSKVKTNSKSIPDKKDGYDLYRTYYVLNEKPNSKQGNRKTSINPNYFYSDYIKELKYIRDREFTVDDGGIKIIAVYRKFASKSDKDNQETHIKEIDEIEPYGIIAADFRYKEKFDVEEGIPVGETLYSNIFSKSHLISYKFIRKYGVKYYNVRISKPITIKYEVTDPITKEKSLKEENRNIVKTYQVSRDYSYWTIEEFALYKIDNAEIQTDVLDDKIILMPKEYQLPNIIYSKTDDEESHIFEPKYSEIRLESETYERNTFPDFDFRHIAEASVDKIKCKNDKLIIDSEIIMSDEMCLSTTKAPIDLDINNPDINQDVLYIDNLMIPSNKENANYKTKAIIKYKAHLSINNQKEGINFNVEINDVNIHTPVICDGMVQNRYRDNQMINPKLGMASLILDLPFYVSLTTIGEHKNYNGYGYRDYSKYTKSKEVKFPFDVYLGNSSDGYFIPKNTWVNTNSDTQYYIPTWVDEGIYSIKFRATSINGTELNKRELSENYANYNSNNYVAIDDVVVNVSGRIYNFNLYDVSDYPLWETVFRKEEASAVLSGYKYNVDKLPLRNGLHPQYSDLGSVKLGYYTRFSLTTTGNMDGDNDYIRITPSFYHINNDGGNRQEIDIYYSETIDDVKRIMIKMGSSFDIKNKKSIRTGDTFLAINEKELYQTSVLRGITLDDLKNQNKNVFTFTNIMIPPSLRTFVGYIKNVPNNISKDQIAKSVQKWYGEYYLPSELYIAPKNFDIKSYIEKHGAINYKESFWLNEGYIIVNFDIESIRNGKRHLTYINPINSQSGYCNMWQREGFKYETYDGQGNLNVFLDGDYVLYYTDKSAQKDWISAGTH